MLYFITVYYNNVALEFFYFVFEKRSRRAKNFTYSRNIPTETTTSCCCSYC